MTPERFAELFATDETLRPFQRRFLGSTGEPPVHELLCEAIKEKISDAESAYMGLDEMVRTAGDRAKINWRSHWFDREKNAKIEEGFEQVRAWLVAHEGEFNAKSPRSGLDQLAAQLRLDVLSAPEVLAVWIVNGGSARQPGDRYFLPAPFRVLTNLTWSMQQPQSERRSGSAPESVDR